MPRRDFLDLSDAGGDGVAALLADALERKAKRMGWPKGRVDPDRPLAGRILATIFEKPSTRTRVSFDVAIRQLGGTSLVLDAATMQLGRGESIADTARVLSSMVDAIAIRTDDPRKMEKLARYSTVPVINALTDASHPCQIVADLMTVIESGRALPGLVWAWCGDGNNVLHSIMEAAGLFKFTVRVACPEGYEPAPHWVERARAVGAVIEMTTDPRVAVAGADVVVTDTWVSMGQIEAEAKKLALAPYQVNEELMALAAQDAIFLHCLPAHRGEEVTSGVIDGPRSRVWDEAENRLHAQKSILLWVFNRLG